MKDWQTVLKDMEFEHAPISSLSEQRKAQRIKAREVGIKHKGTGSVIRLNDNGTIDAFAGPQLGIRLDPRTNAINLIGDVVNINSSRFNVKTKQHGFTWNGRALDPEVMGSEEMTTDRREKAYYSEMLMDMMEEAGLDTYR